MVVPDINEFDFYLRFAKPLVLSLSKPDERILAAAWVQKLRDPNSGEEKLRVDYLKLLLFVLQRKRLARPFTENPNSYETLERFPEGFQLIDVAKALIQAEEHERRKRSGGPSGDNPSFSTDYSADFLEYTAAQDIPKFGVHAYYAISKDPLPFWDYADRGIFPKTAFSAVAFGTQPISGVSISLSTPSVSKSRSKSPESRSKSRKRSSSESSRGKSPPTSPFGGDAFPEDRIPPSWGSNLVTVTEPPKEASEIEETPRRIPSPSRSPRAYSPQLPQIDEYEDWTAVTPPSFHEPPPLYAYADDVLPERPEVVTLMRRGVREYSPPAQFQPTPLQLQTVEEPAILRQELNLPTYDADKIRANIMAHRKRMAQKKPSKKPSRGVVKKTSKSKQVVKKTSSTMGPKGRTIQEATSATEVEMVTVEPTPASRIPAPGSKPSSEATGSKLPARAGTKLPVPAQKKKASKKVQITMSAAQDYPGIGDLSAASLPYRTPSPRPSGIPPQLEVASPMYDAEELSQYGIQPGDLRNVDFNVNIEGGIEAPPDFAYDEVSAEMDAWDQRMTQIEAENAPSLPYLTPPLPTQYSPQLPSGSVPDDWFAESPPSYYEPLMLHEDYALRQDELPEMPAMAEASTRRSREYSPIRTPEFVRPSIQPIPEPSCLTDTLELPKYDIEKMRKAVEAFKKKQAGKVAKKIGKPGTVKTRIQKKTSKSVTTEETTTQTGIPCPASSSRIPQPGSRIPCPGARPSGSRTAVSGSKIPMRGSKVPRARQKPPPKMEKLIAQAAPEYPDIGDLSAASLPYRTPSPRRPPVASPAPSLPYRTPSPRRGIEPPMYDMEELQQYGLDPEDLRDVELDFAIKDEEFVMPPDSSYQEVQQDEIDEETKPSSQAAQSIIDEANRQLKAVDDLLQEKLNKVTKHRKPFMGLQDVSGEFETGDDMEWQEAEEFFAEKKEPSPYKPTRQPLQEIFPGVSFDAGFDFLEDEDAGILVEMDYDEIESEAQPKPLSPTRSIKDLVQEIMEQVSSTVPPADVGVAVTTPRRSPTPRRVSPGLFGETPPQLASPVDRFTAQELAEMQYAELLSPEARRPSPRTPPRRRATWSGSPPSPVRRTFTPTGPRIATPRTPEVVDPFGDVDDIGVSPIRPPSTVFGWTTPERLKKPRPETISPPIAVDTASPLIEEEFPEEYYEELLFPESPESPGIIEYDYDLTPEDLDVDIGELLKSPEIQQVSPSIQTILERYEYTDGFFDRERPYTSGYIQSGNSRIKLQRRAPIPMMSPIQEDLEAFETPPRGQASVQPGYRSPQPRIPSPVVGAQPQLSEEDRRFIEHYIPPERQELMKRVSALVADVPYHQIPDWIPPPPDSPVFVPFQDTTEGVDFGVISPPPEFADFEEPEDLPFDDFEQMEAFVAGLSYDIVEAEPLPEDASFIQPELVGSPVSPFTIDSGVGGDFLVEETPIQFPRSPPATPPRRQPRMEPRRQPSPESPYEDPMEMWLDLIEDCMMQSLTPPKKDVFQAGVRRVQRHPERKVMSPVMEVPPDYQEEYLPFRRQVWKATGKMEKRPIQLQRGVLRPKAKPGLPTLSEHIDYPESPVRAGVSPERPFETRRERMDRMRGRAQRRRLDFDGMVSPDRRQPAVYGPRLEYFEATPLTPPSPHTRILQELQPLPEQPWPQQLMGEARLGVFEAQQTILDEALPENLPSPIQTYTHVHGWRTPEKFKVQAEPLPDFNIYMPTDATPLYEETFEELVEEEEEQYSPIGTEKPGFGIDEEFPDLDQYTPPPQTVPQRYPSPIPGPSWRTPQQPPSPRTPQRYPSPIPGPSWRTPQPPPSPRTPQRYPSPIPGPSWRTPQPPPSPSPSPRTPSPFLRSTSPRTPPCTPVRQKPPEDIFRKVSQTVIGIEQFSPPGMMAPPGSPPTPMSYPEAMQEMINVLTTGEYEVPPRRRPTILYGHNERKPIWVQRHPVRPQLSPVPDDRAEPPDGHVYWPGPHVPNVVKPSRPVLSPNRLHPMRQRSPLYANTPPSSAKRRSPELPAYWADAAELYHLMPVNVRRPPQAYPPDEEVTPQKPSRPREERRRRAKPRRLGFDEPPQESREVQVQVQEELSEINVTLSPRSPIYTVSKFDELPPSPERRRVPPPQTIPVEPWSPPSPPLVVPRPPRFSPPPRDPRLPTVVSPQRVGAVSPPEGYYSPPPSPVPPTPPTPPSPPTPPGSPAQLERLRRNIEKHQYTDQRYDTMREMMMAAQVFSGGKQIPVRLRSQKPSYKLGRIEEVSPGLERYPSPPRRVIEGELLPISPPTPVRTPTAEERAAMQYEMLIRTPPRRYDSGRPILDQLDVEAAKFQPSLFQNQQYAWAWESPTRERPVTLPTAPVYHDIDVSPPHLYGSPTEEVLPSPPDFTFEVDDDDTLDVSPIQYYSPEGVSPQSPPSPYRSYTPPLYQPPAASPPTRSPSFIRRVREHQYTEQFFDRARPGATKTVQSGKRNVNLHQRYVPPDLGAIEELRERPILESPGGLRPPIYATGAPRSAEKISPEDLFPEAVRLVARRPRSPPGAVKDVTPTKTPTRISEGGRRVPMSKRLGPTAKVRRKLHMEDDGEGVFVHTEFRSPEKLPSPRTPPRAVWSPPSVGGTPSRTPPKARSPGVIPRRSPSHRTPQSTVTKVTSKETFIRYLPSPNLSPSDYETYEVSPPFGGRTSPGPGSPINEAMTTSFIAEEMEDFQWMG